MRKITKESVDAFINGRYLKKSNMEVTVGRKMYLHGNCIARIEPEGNVNTLYISNWGWSSNTTKERLNWIPWVSVTQKNFVWYLNGNEWNWQWTPIHWNNRNIF